MIRPATFAAIALGLLTALAIGQLGLLMTSPADTYEPYSLRMSNADAVAHAFYRGINTSIAAGEPALDALITTDFVDHSFDAGDDRNGAELSAQLLAIGETQPDVRFSVIRVSTSGTIATVDLTATAGNPDPIGGWTITLPVQSQFREILRIDEDRVAERWGTAAFWAEANWSLQLERPVGMEQLRQPAIQEFQLEPKAEVDLIASETFVVLVESGEMRVDPPGENALGVSQSSSTSLIPGVVRIVETAGILHLRNVRDAPAEFWTIGLDTLRMPGTNNGESNTDHPAGIEGTATVSAAVQLLAQSVRLSVAEVTVPSGAELSADPVYMQAVAVVAGAVQDESVSGDAFFSIDTTRLRPLSGSERAIEDQGFVILGEGRARVRVDGPEPATLLVLSIEPVSDPSSRPIRTGPG